MCIWPTEVVHKTYKKCTSDLQLMTASNLQSVHSTLKSTSDLKKCTYPTYNWWLSDLQKEYTDLQKCKHSTYKKCTSDLRKVYIRPKKVYIRPTKSVHLTYKKCTSDLQKEGIYRCLLNQLAPCTWLELTTACTGRIKEKKCVTELYSCWPTLSPLRCQP